MLATVFDKRGEQLELVEFWKVSRTSHQPIWVQEAFEKKYFQWVDNHLKILISGLNPEWWKQSGRYVGYGIYVRADWGDIVDRTNCRVLTEENFKKTHGYLFQDSVKT